MKHMTLKTVDGGTLSISKIVLGSSSLHTIWRTLGEEAPSATSTVSAHLAATL